MEIKKVIIGKGEMPDSCLFCGKCVVNGNFETVEVIKAECDILKVSIRYDWAMRQNRHPDCPLEEVSDE